MGWRRIIPVLLRRRSLSSRSHGSAAATSTALSSSPSVARCMSSLSHSQQSILSMDPLRRGTARCRFMILPAHINENSVQQLLQQMGIFTSRSPVLSPADASEQPVPSPLTMVPSNAGGKTGTVKKAAEARTAQAILKKIKQSPKKVNLVAKLVRGMRVEDALLQLSVTVKRAAKTLQRVIVSARANATNNHGLDGDRLIVAEAFVGKGKYLRRVRYHAKGRSGVMHHPSCRITVIVKEMTDEQEAELARLRTMNFRERARYKGRLLPHRLIETTWQWHHKPRVASSFIAPQSMEAMRPT